MPLLPPPRDLVSVHMAATEFEARVIHDLLQDAGIGAMMRSYLVPGYEIPVPPGMWGDVLVRVEDREKAVRVIGDYLDALRAAPEEPPAS